MRINMNAGIMLLITGLSMIAFSLCYRFGFSLGYQEAKFNQELANYKLQNCQFLIKDK